MATPQLSTLSLHDALPIFGVVDIGVVDIRIIDIWIIDVRVVDIRIVDVGRRGIGVEQNLCGLPAGQSRSEEHTSELQSPCNFVCRLLLDNKKQRHTTTTS